jgi:hypothetical protein
LKEQKRSEGILIGAQVPKGFYSQLDSKGQVSKCLMKLQSMVSFRGLCEVREFSVIPLEVTSINNNTTNGSSVTTKIAPQLVHPLGPSAISEFILTQSIWLQNGLQYQHHAQ